MTGAGFYEPLSAASSFVFNTGQVVVPASRLNEEFFQLSTRIAGAIIRKFVNCRPQLVILGNISQWVAGSNALRDFVYDL